MRLTVLPFQVPFNSGILGQITRIPELDTWLVLVSQYFIPGMRGCSPAANHQSKVIESVYVCVYIYIYVYV